MSKELLPYQSPEEYHQVSDALYAVCGMVLISFARHECDTKNTIIRNFVARAAMSLKGIFALWDISDYQDAWVIYRALLDRMFHLHHIGENNEFNEYDDWSFFEQCKAQNKVKSSSDFKHEAVGWIYELTEEQKKKAKSLSQNKPTWKRPKAAEVAKSMGMDFLYHFGYDFASTHVHPMANDGQQDFHTITRIEPCKSFPSQISVLSNSVLATTMILQDALNRSSFRWRKELWDFLDEVRAMLRSGDTAYMRTFIKLSDCFQNESLCKPLQPTPNDSGAASQ